MDNLRFVLESPHIATTQKKRPRLVTSCDNCRLKKIKCVQSKNQEKCEACEAGGVLCEFRDRERYFAERSRIVTAGSGSAPSSRRSSRSPPYPSRSPAPASTDASEEWYAAGSATDLHHMRYMSSSPAYGVPSSSSSSLRGEWLAPADVGNAQPSSYFPTSPRERYNSFTVPGAPLQGASNPGYTGCLFDNRRADFPDSALMPYYIQVFSQYFSRTFPFLSNSELCTRFHEGTLSSLMANAIAALAARYAQSPAILEVGSSAAVNAYCAMARSLVSQSSLVPYIDILHAVILLAWAEYKCGRSSGFAEYTHMAMKMAVSLGLATDSAPPGVSDRVRAMQHSTWTTVLQLQQQLNTSAPAPPLATTLDQHTSLVPPKLSTGSSIFTGDFTALHFSHSPTAHSPVYL